ncbi:MAG: acyltransferase [Candidatus Aureabacteria bacterium]|nr:acyltransferase [Candidatus Auribacterota bacterium]
MLSCKNGDIVLEENVNIGANSYIFSGSTVILRKNTLVAAYCYFIGGDHELTDPDKSFLEQPQVSKGIETGENCWFGAGVKIQDGAKIGKGSVIGTGAVVTKNIPAYSVAVGLPARVVSDRKPK